MKKTRFFVTLLCLAIASTMAIAESGGDKHGRHHCQC